MMAERKLEYGAKYFMILILWISVSYYYLNIFLF
jgi:hypothetical protein